MKVLVCGGRDYDDRDRLFTVLDRIHLVTPIELIVCGAQRKRGPRPWQFIGADWLAIEWALSREVPFNGRPARWGTEGKTAGFKRNVSQLQEHLAILDLCVAAPGGNGTAHMIKLAEHAGIRVLPLDEPE